MRLQQKKLAGDAHADLGLPSPAAWSNRWDLPFELGPDVGKPSKHLSKVSEQMLFGGANLGHAGRKMLRHTAI